MTSPTSQRYKLIDLQVREIREILDELGDECNQTQLAHEYDITPGHVSNIKYYRRWGHLEP